METKKFYHLPIWACFGFIVGFAFLLRIVIGTFYYNGFDLVPYNIPWALGTQDGVFSIYSTLENLDYPPFFPALLGLVSGGVALGEASQIPSITMFFIKLIPILFDTALVALFFLIGKHYSLSCALLLSSAWALNLSAIYNCAFWGQTDSMMLLFLLLTCVTLQRGYLSIGCICFAIGCLTKLQTAYFAPVLLCELYFKHKPLRATKALGTGLAVGILGWLPFMIGSNNWKLPFDIYFGGFGKYNHVNLYAANIYGLGEFNFVTKDLSLFGGSYDWTTGLSTGGFTFSHFSTILLVISLGALVCAYVVAKRNHSDVPVAVHGLFFMNSIFMLTIKMHERYQIPIVMFALLCFVVCRDRRWFWTFVAITAITFVNQFLVLAPANFGEKLQPMVPVVLPILSVFNILLYTYFLYLYIARIMTKEPIQAEAV